MANFSRGNWIVLVLEMLKANSKAKVLVLVHKSVAFEKQTDSQDDLQHIYSYKIRILLEKLAINMCHICCQNKPLPVVAHVYAVLKVHLSSWDKL